MLLPFSFDRQMRPFPYALWAFGMFFSQHAIALLVLAARGPSFAPLALDHQFFLMPLQMLARHGWTSNTTLILSFAYLLIAAWVLAALSFQRAADADVSRWLAAFAVTPVVQLPVILILSVIPSRPVVRVTSQTNNIGASGMATAAQGLAAGVGLTVFAVAVGALLFGAYGFGVFVVSPFMIGVTTGYFANRIADVGRFGTAELVLGALLLGGIALVLVALEGIVCIVLAAPLAIATALMGGLLGRAIAVNAKHPPGHALCGLALLPLAFTAERMLPAAVSFETQSTIVVAAPPEAVWDVLMRTDLAAEPVALPFRLGVAYPLRGDMLGEGVGSIRVGEFSTGTVLEQVTEWIPNRQLTFVMLTDLPAMRELSPYAHVHAPHVTGYFRTTNTSFELARLTSGHSEIIERTSHELRLEPVLYWLPLARWVVHENNARVLAHIKRQAEKSDAPEG
jgi:hypothetical protein